MPFLIDLHIHSSRYSPCAPTLDPLDIASQLAAKQLNGGVLTEHDQLWPPDELKKIQHSFGSTIRLYRGAEISTASGHVVAIGLDELSAVPPGVSLSRLVAVAREHQAALIYVHPYHSYRGLTIQAHQLLPHQGLHAIEVISSITQGADTQRAAALARQNGLAEVGGSDAHALAVVGTAATRFFSRPDDEKTLAQMIIQGQCQALTNLNHADALCL